MTTHNLLGYFDVRFDSGEFVEPRHRYAIFSSPRTGSNYLCARLNNLEHRLGIPMEYLHTDAVRLMGSRLLPGAVGPVKLERYLDAVARVRTTRDGWFGVKIQPNQLFPVFDEDMTRVAAFLDGFDRLIFLTRADKLGQAVSGAIAHATGVWFNFGEEPAMANSDAALLFPQIDRLHTQYVAEDGLISQLRRKLAGRPQLHIAYEEIQADPQLAFQRVAAFLGLEKTALAAEKVITQPTRKPLGERAEQVRAAYLGRPPE
jgi:LPS sulfotransferase NodH